MAALLSTEMKQQEVVVQYIQSAREHGIEVLSPDVNQSVNDFNVVFRERTDKNGNKVKKKVILFGLGAIKGVMPPRLTRLLKPVKNTKTSARFMGFVKKSIPVK